MTDGERDAEMSSGLAKASSDDTRSGERGTKCPARLLLRPPSPPRLCQDSPAWWKEVLAVQAVLLPRRHSQPRGARDARLDQRGGEGMESRPGGPPLQSRYGPDGRACRPIVVRLDKRPDGTPLADIDEEGTQAAVTYGGNVLLFRDPAYDWGDE